MNTSIDTIKKILDSHGIEYAEAIDGRIFAKSVFVKHGTHVKPRTIGQHWVEVTSFTYDQLKTWLNY